MDTTGGAGFAPAKEPKLGLTDRTIEAIVDGIRPQLERIVDSRLGPLEKKVEELSILLRGVPGIENSGVLNATSSTAKDQEARLRIQERIGYGMVTAGAIDAITRNWVLFTKGAGKVLAAIIFWRHP